jgi:hypothetical protein
MELPWLTIAVCTGLVVVPLGLLGVLGIVVFILKAGTVAQKAVEPPTEDGGEYRLEQGREVGRSDAPGQE